MGNYRSGKLSFGNLSSGKLTFWDTVVLGNFLLGKILWESTLGNSTSGILSNIAISLCFSADNFPGLCNHQAGLMNGLFIFINDKIIALIYSQVVLSLLGKNGDINAVLRYKERYESEEKLTVLMTAAKKGQNTLIKSLLEQGAEVNQKKETETGNEEECDKVNANTALAFAAENGAVEVVNTLIEHGADVKQEGELSLLLAASDGYDEIVQMLIEKGADVNFVEPKSENTALTLAAADGNNKSVLTLIEHGADVNHQNKKQRTPLIMAVTEGGNIDVIRTLLKHNAEKDTKDEDCYSALIYAVISMSSDYVSLLLEHGAGMTKFYYDGKEETCLSWAAACGDNDIVTALIKHGADVNFANEENETALSNAAKGGYIECVEKLLEYGAKVDIGNPVAAAVDGGNIKIAAILLKHGACNIERNLDEDPLLTKAILEMSFKGKD